jgi:hypothetical protein
MSSCIESFSRERGARSIHLQLTQLSIALGRFPRIVADHITANPPGAKEVAVWQQAVDTANARKKPSANKEQ